MKKLLMALMLLGGVANAAPVGFGGVSADSVEAKDASAPVVVAPTTPTLDTTTVKAQLAAAIPGVLNLIADPSKEFKALGADIKNNTGFRIDSAIPYESFDWKHGQYATGAAVPFLHVGSYLYTAGAIGRGDSAHGTPVITDASAFEGVRLNDLTRPALYFLMNQITFHQLDKGPLLAAIANGSSVGIKAG